MWPRLIVAGLIAFDLAEVRFAERRAIPRVTRRSGLSALIRLPDGSDGKSHALLWSCRGG